MKWRQRATIRYFCYGALFGLCFPVCATAFDIWLQHLRPTLGVVTNVQAAQPLHWVIDTAPFFLGLFAAIAGWRQDQLEHAHTLLAHEHTNLEQRVAERTEALQRTAETLQASLHEREQLLQTVQDLQVPILPVLDGVLLLPLFGALGSVRLATITDSLLHAIQQQHATTVLLDVTGIAMLTAQDALLLQRLATTAQLLGTQIVMVGVRPSVAMAFAEYGSGICHIVIQPDLQRAITFILNWRAWRVSGQE